ncbi:MAG: ATP synthase F1 subunit gamma [candidate division Zixibacteria bacterium]|nr:ATP synthase F1 subunit gamma [candidate division Zixibacteria bacterium]
MESLRDIRNRIRSVESTHDITKAMEMVAAVKLRRAQSKAESSRPYALKMQEMLGNLSSASEEITHPLFEKREAKKVALVVISSDRGLCGSYNSNIIRAAQEFIKNYTPQNVMIINVGKKGYDFYRKRGFEIKLKYLSLGGNLVLNNIKSISEDLTKLFLSGEADEIHILYTKFISAMSYRVNLQKFLNIESKDKDEKEMVDYIFEPEPEEIFTELLPRYCSTVIQMALAEAFASEHGSRMIAMGGATKNAEEMIEHLTLQRNKARQASITKELLEVVSGAEALR